MCRGPFVALVQPMASLARTWKRALTRSAEIKHPQDPRVQERIERFKQCSVVLLLLRMPIRVRSKLKTWLRLVREKQKKQTVGPDTKKKSASQVKKNTSCKLRECDRQSHHTKNKNDWSSHVFCAHMENNPTSLFIMLTNTAQRMERQQRRIRRLEQRQIASMSRHQHVISTEVLKNL